MIQAQTIGFNANAVSALTRILVVEGDPVIRATTKLALQEAGGFVVEVCGRGAQTVRIARRFRPDLILLDANLPDMNGPAVLAAIRRDPEVRDLPVIFVTGAARPTDAEGYRALGAIGVIAKPFYPYDLAERIRGIWEKSRG